MLPSDSSTYKIGCCLFLIWWCKIHYSLYSFPLWKPGRHRPFTEITLFTRLSIEGMKGTSKGMSRLMQEKDNNLIPPIGITNNERSVVLSSSYYRGGITNLGLEFFLLWLCFFDFSPKKNLKLKRKESHDKMVIFVINNFGGWFSVQFVFYFNFSFLKRKSVYCCQCQGNHTRHVHSIHCFVLFLSSSVVVISVFALIYNKHKGTF